MNSWSANENAAGNIFTALSSFIIIESQTLSSLIQIGWFLLMSIHNTKVHLDMTSNPVRSDLRGEWVGVVKHQFSNFLAISSREQDNFQWDDVRFVLDQHGKLDFYSASSLKQQSADRHVAPLWHIILIPSQPVFLLNAKCLAKKQQIPIL